MSDEGNAAGDGAPDEPADDGFIYVSLTGKRFDPLGMPADSTVELKALRDALYEMARQAWLDEHPGRVRVPKRFDEVFDLRLVSVGEGSARPKLRLNVPSWFDAGDDDQQVLPAIYRSRDLLVDALSGVRDEFALPDRFPVEQHAPALAKLGRSLDENEGLQIGLPRQEVAPGEEPPVPVTLDAQVRSTLAQIDEALRAEPAPEPHALEGIITELDGHQRSFHLRVVGEGLTHCVIAPGETTLARKVKEVLADDGVTAPDVRVRGTAVVPLSGRVRKIYDVTDIDVVRTLGEKALMARLDEAAALDDGWWGPHSVKVPEEIISKVRPLLRRVAELPVTPAVGPRPDGSIAFEVEVSGCFLTATVEDEGRRMFLCMDNPRDPVPAESEEPFEAERLIDFLRTGTIA